MVRERVVVLPRFVLRPASVQSERGADGVDTSEIDVELDAPAVIGKVVGRDRILEQDFV